RAIDGRPMLTIDASSAVMKPPVPARTSTAQRLARSGLAGHTSSRWMPMGQSTQETSSASLVLASRRRAGAPGSRRSCSRARIGGSAGPGSLRAEGFGAREGVALLAEGRARVARGGLAGEEDGDAEAD